MAPKFLAPMAESGDPALYRQVAESNYPANYGYTLNKQNTLNGYTPRNQKLKCFPYNYLLMSNNIGQNSILHYEKFNNPGDDVCDFRVDAVLNPGCSIKITPRFYNGSDSSDIDAISLGKLPICNFQNDMYTNWLTQNSINILGTTITTDDLNMANSAISSVVGTATNLAVGNYVGAAMSLSNGVTGITNSLIQQKQHNMISPTVSGSLNSADVNVASGNNTFHFYKMSIKEEYAKIIDNYFDMFGYKVNDVKIPNITGRPNWNYIKTIDCNITGNIPQEDMQTIKQIFNSGVTLWHNTSTFLDYSQNNR